MADNTPETTPAPQTVDMTDFAKAIGRSVSQAIDESHPKKVSIGEYMRREAKGRSVLKREYYEGGFHVNPRVLSNKAIDLLNQITRSGRYIDRIVEVAADSQTVTIQWNNRTPDQRFENAKKWVDLEDMLSKIVVAQKAEDAEDEELRFERQERVNKANARVERHFGEGKATREAREKAGV